jgi:hypothetical protein
MNTQSPNSTGVMRTQQQLDDSYRESYWQHAIEYALAYYVSGRFAVHAQIFVAPNLLHHAVELLIKANLSVTDTAGQIRKYGHKSSYGHSLNTSWAEFKRRSADQSLNAYDTVIAELDKFENVRHPDKLVDGGGMFSVGLAEPTAPNTVTVGETPARHHWFVVALGGKIDCLCW